MTNFPTILCNMKKRDLKSNKKAFVSYTARVSITCDIIVMISNFIFRKHKKKSNKSCGACTCVRYLSIKLASWWRQKNMIWLPLNEWMKKQFFLNWSHSRDDSCHRVNNRSDEVTNLCRYRQWKLRSVREIEWWQLGHKDWLITLDKRCHIQINMNRERNWFTWNQVTGKMRKPQ